MKFHGIRTILIWAERPEEVYFQIGTVGQAEICVKNGQLTDTSEHLRFAEITIPGIGLSEMPKTMPTSRNTYGLIVALLICFGASAIGALLTTPHIDGWYASLNRPSYAPPNWIFGPVWSALFAMMAVAVWLVWKIEDARSKTLPLTLFFIQLILNVGWSALFFAFQDPFLAFLEIIVLWIMILLTTIAFARFSNPAAGLMIPYLSWVTFAAVLNYGFWSLNS